VSWPRDAFEALRQIVLIEHRMNELTERVGELARTCQDLDRRMIRIETKIDLFEKAAIHNRRALPEK